MSDSTAVTKPDEATATGVAEPSAQTTNVTSSPGKGKGKGKAVEADDSMDVDEEEDDEDDDEDDEEEEEDEDVDDEDLKEVDPSAILPGRSRRNRPQVDYSSAEAHAKAGLKPGEGDDDD